MSSPRIARAVNLLALIPVLGRGRFEAVVVGEAVGVWVGAGATAGVGVEPPLGAGVGWVLGVPLSGGQFSPTTQTPGLSWVGKPGSGSHSSPTPSLS